MTEPNAFILSLAMLAAFALFAGGGWLIANKRDARKGLLMLIAAAVLVFNVAIWTL